MWKIPFPRLVLVLLLLRAGIAPAPAIAGDTGPLPAGTASAAMFRGGPARTGENPGPGPRGTPTVRWRAWLGQKISSSPAVVDGVVYVGSVSPVTRDGGALHAVDAATGEEIWRLPTVAGDGIFTGPAVAHGLVYAGSYDGIVVAAETATGVERWRFQTETGTYSSPAVVDGVVYLGDNAGYLYALDAATGSQRWRFAIDQGFEYYVTSSPAVVDGTVYVVFVALRAGRTSL